MRSPLAILRACFRRAGAGPRPRRCTHQDLLQTEVRLMAVLQIILMKQSELPAFLAAIKAQLVKAQAEITAKIKALTDALNAQDNDLSPEAAAALQDLQGEVQAIDDINPDALVPQPDPAAGGPSKADAAGNVGGAP